jgi:hypothetical protein
MGLGAIAVFWVLGSILGVVDAFEHLMRGIGFTGFHVLSFQLLFAVAFLGAVWCGFMVGMTVVAAALYNVLAQRNGGVRVFVGAETLTGHEAGSNGNGSNGKATGNGSNGNGNGSKQGNGKASSRLAVSNHPIAEVPPIAEISRAPRRRMVTRSVRVRPKGRGPAPSA